MLAAAIVDFDKRLIEACMQTVWTQIRLLPMEQSDLGPYCLLHIEDLQNTIAGFKADNLSHRCQ